MTLANSYWILWVVIGFGAVESVAILNARYDWTLSKTLRDANSKWPAFRWLFAILLIWLYWHITIQKKDKKDDSSK